MKFVKDVKGIVPKDETILEDKVVSVRATTECIGLFSKGANIDNAPDPEEIVNEIDQLQNKGSE
ncbi:MAG: hypothetical protein IJN64_06240 [Lachnospiraceae bacterium]|nr:hypothetical protein [Lachnospiraceae bacterium]